MEEHKIIVRRTAHYYTIGEPTQHTRQFWLACHGYGQLAGKFIHKFEAFDDGRTYVLAPEGLSKFYMQGYDGGVGASWMTRLHRLDEIDDYCHYLQTLYDQTLARLPADVQIILMGFSQGCATQMRWMLKNFPRYHHLVLWAGLPPEDIDYRPHLHYFEGKTMTLLYGEQDPFLTEERMQWHLNFWKEQRLPIRLRPFQGRHEVDRSILGALKEELGVSELG